MLVLTRKINQSIVIGDNVKITIAKIEHGQIRLAINAPKEVPIHRAEVYERIKKDEGEYNL